MAVKSRDADGERGEEDVPALVGLRTSPDRYVFTERGNTDGWIATDSVVDLDR